MLLEHLLPTGMLLLLRAREPEQGRCIASAIFPAMNQHMFVWGSASWRPDQIWRPNELIKWAGMRHWKAKGIPCCDMGGGGEYKRKYGGADIAIPRLKQSKHAVFGVLRKTARNGFRSLQRVKGVLKRRH